MTDCHIYTVSGLELLRKLKQARVQAGLTQIQVAAMIHCTQSAISKKESGDRRFYASELLQLCQLYGVSMDEFK